MKILLAGDWHSAIHEQPMAAAMARLGHLVHPFAWHTYSAQVHKGLPVLLSVLRLGHRAQNKYLAGPLIRQINRDLVDETARHQPDLLFIYRGTHIQASALRAIRAQSPRTTIVGYTNDDPFAATQPRWLWRHFLGAIPEYDLILAYRPHNEDELRRAGARATGLLMPWFVPDSHRPMPLTADEHRRYDCDVVFVGHFEPDDRVAAIEALAAAGVDVKIWGPGRSHRSVDWDESLRASPHLRRLAPVTPVWGEDYCKALCGARLALCFLSKRNRDVYTRRCFEIPATGTMLLSEYSDELAHIYREGEEADFFRSVGELVSKVRFYLDHDDVRRDVAARGRARAFADGHDVTSRVETMLRSLALDRPRACC